MSDKNLEFWQSVSKTDPSATKTSNQGGREQTSINGYWMIQKATEKFGMVGIGWGWEVTEERWDNGAMIPIKQDDGSTRLEQSKTHTIKILLWFMRDGKRGEITQYGHTQAIYKSKYGVSDDGEAPKKSLMDAIKKALSMLGFCSDIFTGMFEDREYVQALEVEQAIERAEDRDAEIAARRLETTEYITRNIEAVKGSKTASEAKGLSKVAILHLSRQKSIQSITDLCERGIAAISKESESKLQELAK
jgi:hypothetical protein